MSLDTILLVDHRLKEINEGLEKIAGGTLKDTNEELERLK